MKNKLKIFFLIPDLSYGGAQKTIVNIANFLANNSKFEISIIILNNRNQSIVLDKKISLINLHSKRLIFCVHKLLYCIIKFKPKLILSTTVHLNLINIFLNYYL